MILADPALQPGQVATRIITFLIAVARYSYPVILICLFIISFGNRPQAFRNTYKIVMVLFGVIGAVMMGLLVRRVTALVGAHVTGLGDTDAYNELLNPMIDQARVEVTDGGQLLVNAIVMHVANVTMVQLEENLKQARWEALIYLVTLASTIGVFFFASFVQLDFAHMFTCFIQCEWRLELGFMNEFFEGKFS